MRKYKYTWVSLYLGMLDELYCRNHGLWSDSLLKEYLMVLPYLKGLSIHLGVILMVNVFWLFMKYKGFISLLWFTFWVKDHYKWYKSTFLGRKIGNVYFVLFCRFFKRKIWSRHSKTLLWRYVQNLKKIIIDLSSPHKTIQLK